MSSTLRETGSFSRGAVLCPAINNTPRETYGFTPQAALCRDKDLRETGSFSRGAVLCPAINNTPREAIGFTPQAALCHDKDLRETGSFSRGDVLSPAINNTPCEASGFTPQAALCLDKDLRETGSFSHGAVLSLDINNTTREEEFHTFSTYSPDFKETFGPGPAEVALKTNARYRRNLKRSRARNENMDDPDWRPLPKLREFFPRDFIMEHSKKPRVEKPMNLNASAQPFYPELSESQGDISVYPCWRKTAHKVQLGHLIHAPKPWISLRDCNTERDTLSQLEDWKLEQPDLSVSTDMVIENERRDHAIFQSSNKLPALRTPQRDIGDLQPRKWTRMGLYDDGDYISGTTVNCPLAYPQHFQDFGVHSRAEFDTLTIRLVTLMNLKGWLMLGKHQIQDLYGLWLSTGVMFSKRELHNKQKYVKTTFLKKEDIKLLKKARGFAPYMQPLFASLLKSLPTTKQLKKQERPVFQGLGGFFRAMSDVGSIRDEAQTIVSKIKKFRDNIYNKIEECSGLKITENTRKFFDCISVFLAVVLVVWIVRKCTDLIDGMLHIITSCLGELAAPAVKQIRRLINVVCTLGAMTDDLATGKKAEFQAKSSSVVLVTFLGAVAAFITGGKFTGKTASEFVRTTMPTAGVLEACFLYFKDIVSWIVSLMDPDHPWASQIKITNKFQKIRKRIEDRELDMNFNENISRDKSVYAKVKKDFDWLTRNQISLYDLPCLRGKNQLISTLRATAARHFQVAREVSGLFKNRNQPILIWLFGEPGAGKSDIIPILRRGIMHQMKLSDDPYWNELEDSDALMYTKSSASPYFAGYRNQPFMLLDDWGQIQNPEALSRDIADIITLVNTAPAPLNQAAVEEKGNSFFTSRVLFVTSNVRNFSEMKMADQGALGRRITYAFKVRRLRDLPKTDGPLTIRDIDKTWTFEGVDRIGEEGTGLEVPLMKNFPYCGKMKDKEYYPATNAVLISQAINNVVAKLKTDAASPTYAERVVFQCRWGLGGTECDSEDFSKSDRGSSSSEEGDSTDHLSSGTTESDSEDSSKSDRESSSSEEGDSTDHLSSGTTECDSEVFGNSSSYDESVGNSSASEAPDSFESDDGAGVFPRRSGKTCSTVKLGTNQDIELRSTMKSRKYRKAKPDVELFYDKEHMPFTKDKQQHSAPRLRTFTFTQPPYISHLRALTEGADYSLRLWDPQTTWSFEGMFWKVKNKIWDSHHNLTKARDIATEVYDILEHWDVGEPAVELFGKRLDKDITKRQVRDAMLVKCAMDLASPPTQHILRDEHHFRDDFFKPNKRISNLYHWMLALTIAYPNCSNVHNLFGSFRSLRQSGLRRGYYYVYNCAGAVGHTQLPMHSEDFAEFDAATFTDPDLDKGSVVFCDTTVIATMAMANLAGVDLRTLSNIALALNALLVYQLVKTLFGAFVKDVPSWFHSKSRDPNELAKAMRGGDYSQGNFSRGKRAARLDKEGTWFDHRGKADHTKDGYAIAQAGVLSHTRDVSVCKNNWVIHFKFASGEESYCQGLFLDHRQMAFTWHSYYAFDDQDLLEIAFYPDHPSTGVKTCNVIGRDCFSVVRPDRSRDIGIVVFNKAYIPGMRNLWGMIPRRKQAQEIHHGIFRIVSGVVHGQNLMLSEGPFKAHLVKHSDKIVCLPKGRGTYEDTGLTYYVVHDAKGQAGDCGFPYMASVGTDKPLLGIHGARCGNDAFMVPIYVEDSMLSEPQGTGDEPAIAQSFPPGLEERLNPYVPGPQILGAKYVGKAEDIKSFSSPPYSKYFERNPEYAEMIIADEKKHPAPMNKKAQLNRLRATYNFGPTPIPSWSHIDDPKWSEGFCPIRRTFEGFLTFEQALFGDPKLSLCSMASSSKFVGHFFNEPKNVLVDFDAKTYHPKLRERTELYLKAAFAGEDVLPLAAQFAKDELLEEQKVKDNICRIINGHDLAYNIFLRMLTGRYVDLINSHPAQVVPVTGINPISHEWKMVYDQATQFENYLAGDLSKEEAVTNVLMRNSFINHVRSYYIFSAEEELAFRHGLAGLNGYYFERDRFIYLAIRGHSSGHFLTTLYNSYCTWFIHKVAFEHVFEPDECRFEHEVKLRTLGDDSVGSVSDLVKDKYNMVYISEFCREKMGIKYTSGVDKNAEITPFIPKDELTFLGRKFKYKGDKLVGPLRVEAIHDLVIWSVNVPGMTQEQVDQIRIDQAMREACLHGTSFYNQMKNRIENTMSKRSYTVPHIPNHKEMWRQVSANWYKNDYDGRYEMVPCKKASSA